MISLRIAPQSFAFTIFLGILAALPALSIDLSAPTLALLPSALGTTTTVAGLTLSLFMVGFALGQLSGGRVSDQRGRKPVLLIGLVVYTAAGIGCTFSQSGPILVFARFLQGTGAGACSVLSFAIVQDLFDGDAALSKRSYVTVVFGLVPMLAPALGVVLTELGGWRAVHGVLVLAGGLLLAIAAIGFVESRAGVGVERARSSIVQGVKLRGDRLFIGLAAANALSYAVIFGYIAGSPIVIIRQLGFPSIVFAAVFASTAAALTAGAWTSGRLARQGVASAIMVYPSLGATLAATFGLAVVSFAGITSGAILLPLLLVVLFARGVIAPNLQSLAIERGRAQSGSASAVVGVSQLLTGAVASAVVAALLPRLGAAALALPMAVLASAALAVWVWASRQA